MATIYIQGQKAYVQALSDLASRGDADLERVEDSVREIINSVRLRGDNAVREYAERFEGRRCTAIRLVEKEWRNEARETTVEVRRALEEAGARIRSYHERQRESGFEYEEGGVRLGMRVRPVKAAGVYAPGGKARYPSTVLMTAIPAAVAGVERIVLATPNPTPELLAAAEVAGVTEVIDAGGAQAIAALAYGTESVQAVDKIVGPGNIYVACAKRLVFGKVDIDSIAGPSEVLVIADESADPRVVAADLLAQAEHDEDAYPLLITLSESMVERVFEEVEEQLSMLPRHEIARAAWNKNGYAFVVEDRREAIRVADRLAAEHLCLAVRDPRAMLEGIGAVGAAFIGHFTPETAGDYAAGPSHVLPTGGAARFASPLGVYDFYIRTSLIEYSEDALRSQADLLEALAELEGLHGHARAVRVRR